MIVPNVYQHPRLRRVTDWLWDVTWVSIRDTWRALRPKSRAHTPKNVEFFVDPLKVDEGCCTPRPNR